MIDVSNCCGCTACKSICPVQAIEMEMSTGGFLYPKIDDEKCIKCGLCKKVCPMINHANKQLVNNNFFAIKSSLEIRKKSTSGGVFKMIADEWLDKKGIIFGVSFDEKNRVIYKIISSKEELNEILGTKYVQADLSNVFKKIKESIDNNEKVLFIGNPCVVKGLLLYLENKRENLFLIDHICNGVPSPGFWNMYLKYLEEDGKIEDFIFRDKVKANDGHTVSYKVNGENKQINFLDEKFCRIYSKSIGIRNSCFNCKWCQVDRDSDITIGDFWGAEKVIPEFVDGYGISLVITHNEKGLYFINKIKEKCCYKEVRKEDTLQPRLISPPKNSILNKLFVKDIDDALENYTKEKIDKIINKYGA